MNRTETLFSKIINGTVPCHKIYEDASVLAFLDIQPLSRGHTLVIPKEPAASLDQLSDESAAALGRVLPRLCKTIMEMTGTQDYNLLQNNGALAHQAVFHVHFHIIPKPNSKEGLGVNWPAQAIDPSELAKLASQLHARLNPE